jgi:hypothetical protein
VDLRGIFAGQTAILLGGSPSLLDQPYQLLETRGVLVMAMNNAARHVRATLFCSSDHPDCFEPQILHDPGIMKFGNNAWASTPCNLHGAGRLFRSFPNLYFWLPRAAPPMDEFLADRGEVPWYNNTMFVSIHILYQLGVRRIILAGSDFMFGAEADYASGQKLDRLEKKWNLQLYNHIVRDLRMMKPIFDQHGVELLDASKNSRLTPVYPHITLERAVELCRSGFPTTMVAAQSLPHCSKFASRQVKDMIAGWIAEHESAEVANPPVGIHDNSAPTEATNLQTII